MSTTDNNLSGDELLDVVTGEFAEAPELSNPVRVLLEEHFGTDPVQLPVASDNYLPIVAVHLQNAVDKFINAEGREQRLQGVAIPVSYANAHVPVSLLLAPPTLSWSGPSLGSPDYIQQEVSDGRRTVLRRGLFMTRDAEGPAALWVSQTYGMSVEVIAPTEERAKAIIEELRASSYELNPFKGQVITITTDCPGNVIPVYLDRPREVLAEDVILPGDLLKRIEEQALGVSSAKETMLGSGHSLKRGILLYGRPGTGKTHTIRYLISKMPEYTVLTMPASRMQMLTDRLAEIVPYVTPGIMIFDDVDLIAEDRSQWFTNPNRGPLFSLLELMDGIGAESDLLFILTTNVAERLEEAIAARPGRIDQAFEIPPPDGECRARLFALYAKDVKTDIDNLDEIVERTNGVTGSFLKELVRRATVIAAMDDTGDDDDDDDITITGAHVSRALDQLLDPNNEMTAQLLGAKVEEPKPSLGHIAAALQRG